MLGEQHSNYTWCGGMAMEKLKGDEKETRGKKKICKTKWKNKSRVERRRLKTVLQQQLTHRLVVSL